METMAIRLPKEKLDRIEALAKVEQITKSSMGKMLVEIGLEAYGAKGGHLKELASLRGKLKAIQDLIETNGI